MLRHTLSETTTAMAYPGVSSQRGLWAPNRPNTWPASPASGSNIHIHSSATADAVVMLGTKKSVLSAVPATPRRLRSAAATAKPADHGDGGAPERVGEGVAQHLPEHRRDQQEPEVR